MTKKIFLLLALLLVATSALFSNSIDVGVGGAFTGYFIPTVNYRSTDTTIEIVNFLTTEKQTTKTETVNLLFGFGITVPAFFLYNLSNNWGVGATIQLGYSFLGGPEVYCVVDKEQPKNYTPTDYAYFYNSFLGIFNFLARTPDLGKGFSLLLEGGLIVRGGGLTGRYQNKEEVKFPIGSSTQPYRALGFVGPNLFVGFNKEIYKSLLIMPGLRISTEFAYFPTSASGFVQKEFYFLLNFGLEFKLLWDYHIALGKKGKTGSSPAKSGTNQKK